MEGPCLDYPVYVLVAVLTPCRCSGLGGSRSFDIIISEIEGAFCANSVSRIVVLDGATVLV